MKLTKDQVNVLIKNGQSSGLTGKEVLDGLIERGYEPEGIDVNVAKQEIAKSKALIVEKPSFGSRVKETIGDVTGIVKDIGESSQKASEQMLESQRALESGEQGVIRTRLQQVGQAAGAGAGAIGALFKGAGNVLLSDKHEKDVTDVINKFGAKVVAIPEVQNIINKYNELPEAQQRDIDALGGVVSLVTNFLGGEALGAGAKVAQTGIKTGAKAGKEIIETGVESISKGAGKIKGTVGEVVQKSPETLAKFIAPDVDPKFATALKRTTKAEVDDMESVVKKAVENTDNPSAFEVVGNKLADATEQVNKQVKSLSQQKKDIISKAKNGLTDFSKETGTAILEINRALKESNLAKSFISRLKNVKTKIDADNAIDELQDILYKGNKDLTIPVGSAEDMTLKRILGKYNSSLKDKLPSSYKKINESISEKLSNLDLLNKSLGEVVDGVPIRGASLIKQYFSPAGTKAKELFEFIKKNTGYDIGKDAVLAKYMSEIYGETRAKSLLQGIPTTAQGTLDKLLEFTLEKTGVAGKVKALKRKGEILKAKELSK